MRNRNALIVDTGTSYWPCGTYNYKGMTRRDSKNSSVSYRPWIGLTIGVTFSISSLVSFATRISIIYPNHLENCTFFQNKNIN